MKEKKKLSLPIKIFIGMALGIIAGLIFAFAHLGEFTKEWIKPIGTIYVNLLKFLVVPVVLFSIADGVIKAGYPDLFHGNLFDGPDVTPYVAPRSQKRCFDGYVLFDGGLVVPQAFAQLTIKTA